MLLTILSVAVMLAASVLPPPGPGDGSETSPFTEPVAVEPAGGESDAREPAGRPETDAAPPTEESHEHSLSDAVAESKLIVQATLAGGVSFIPAPKRVINTAYVFNIEERLSGPDVGTHVTIYDTGGQLSDGTTMETVESYKLTPGQRYIVFARQVEGQYWIESVLQVAPAAEVVADASGRPVVAIEQGRVLVQNASTLPPLRYSSPHRPEGAAEEEGPTTASLPLPAQARAAAEVDAAAPLQLGQVREYIRQQAKDSVPDRSVPLRAAGPEGGGVGAGPAAPGDASAPGDAPPPSDAPTPENAADAAAPRSAKRSAVKPFETGPAGGASPGGGPDVSLDRTSGRYVPTFQSHYHYMPNDTHWAWATACRGSWNVLVRPRNGIGLLTFKVDSGGNPIRNRFPQAGNGQFNCGVLTSAQMTQAGYDTWEVLGANGVCYTWSNSNNHVTETDVLINSALAADEAQFRKSLTHEYGHSLTLDHETRYMALMYPGTFQQPPNYASLWYTRGDDHRGVRTMLQRVNSNIAAGSWDIASFTDVATYSQSHSNRGTAGSLVMTTISDRVLNVGETATIRNVFLENRGNQPVANVRLRFYLSTNPTISSSDTELASYTWNTFTTSWDGNLNVRVPNGTAPGTYYVGWVLTTDSSEASLGNNTTLLLGDHSANFQAVTVRVE